MRPSDRWKFVLLNGARVILHLLDVVGLALVGLLGAVLATGLEDFATQSLFGLTVSITTRTDLIYVLLLMTGFFLTKSVLSTLALFAITRLLGQVEGDSAGQIAGFLFGSSLTRLESRSRGEVQWAVGSSTFSAFTGLLYSASALVTEFFLFLAIFIVFVMFDLTSALLITAYFTTILLLFQLSLSRRLRQIGQEYKNASVAVSNTALDFSTAFREISTTGATNFFLDRFRHFRGIQSAREASQRFLVGLPRFFVEVALMIGILGLFAVQLNTASLSDGLATAGVFLAGGLRMMAALLPMQNAIAEIRLLSVQASQAHDLIEESQRASFESVDTDLTEAESPDLRGHIQVTGVSHRFSPGEPVVLHNINLQATPGTFTAIIGASGAGKSTLIDLIMGLREPTTGVIRVNGINPANPKCRRPGLIGVVPQDPGLVNASIAENVALGVPKENVDERRVVDLLERVFLRDRLINTPLGIWDHLDSQGNSLSGGERQRLGIARSLYHRPAVVIMDEATSALDTETEFHVAKAIEELAHHSTLLVVAHRLSTVQNARSVLFLENGEVEAEGTLQELIQKSSKVANFVSRLEIRSDPHLD